MIPLRIEGATALFSGPPGSGITGLHVLETQGCCVSRWEPTPQELATLNKGGSVELWVMGGQPPVMLAVSPLKIDPLFVSVDG